MVLDHADGTIPVDREKSVHMCSHYKHRADTCAHLHKDKTKIIGQDLHTDKSRALGTNSYYSILISPVHLQDFHLQGQQSRTHLD